jgi:YHS domain-containing protein
MYRFRVLARAICAAVFGFLIMAAGPLAARSQQPAAPPPHEGHDATPQPQSPGQDGRQPAEATHEEHAAVMTGPLGITRARAGSGTAWLPDVTPMYAIHREFGGWSAMLHQNLFLQYIDESTDRGDSQLGSVNWVMGMAERRARGGNLGIRTMFSLERLTVGECGYPDLLATGEFCNGQPLHDRQHPHDFFMEAAGTYERELSDTLAIQLYAALAGEPALGPVAFPHRISALSTPIAPLTHHWLDSTHISYGVVSAGVFGTRWKAEASAFNGREPDENRFDLDLGALDSFSARLWFVPADRWSLQVSRGHLNEAELPAVGGPRHDVDRTTASATYHQLVGTAGFWSVTGAWGRNAEGDHATDAVLLETDLGLDGRNTVFGRVEGAGKTGEELIIPEIGHEAATVSKLHVGYMRRLPGSGMFEPRLGAALSFSAIPDRVERAYGRDNGFGVTVFLSVRPRAMAMGTRTVAVPPTVSPGPGVVTPAPPQLAANTAAGTAQPHADHAEPPGAGAAPRAGLQSLPADSPGGHVMPGTAQAPAAGPVTPVIVPGSTAPAAVNPGAAPPAGADPHAGHVMPGAPQAPAAAPVVTAASSRTSAQRPAGAAPRPAAAPQAAPGADPHAGHVMPPVPQPQATADAGAGYAMTTPENPAARLADLTCQPRVDPDTAPRATYRGKAYYFCTAADRDLFLKAPAKYLQR